MEYDAMERGWRCRKNGNTTVIVSAEANTCPLQTIACALRDKIKVYKICARSHGITLGIVGHRTKSAGLSCEKSGVLSNLKSLLASTRIPSCTL